MRALTALCLLISLPATAQEGFDAFDDFDDWDEDGQALVWSGFVEPGYGRRLERDAPFATRQSLGDLRARLETEWVGDLLTLTFKGEALHDDYASETAIELRDLNLRLSPGGSVDLKIGRQVLTWGTGDLLFLNDLFPKDWVSFFAGRDDEYLKLPSDAIRATWYTSKVNVDIAWTPYFEPDEYLTGERFSFFSPQAGAIVAPRPPLAGVEPRDRIENGELALRFFKTAGSTEYAGYLYRGFFKRPLGVDTRLKPIFPPLSVLGASLRRPLAGGLFNAEFAYHDSRADGSGSNPRIPNDQLRLLVGYEFEARPRFAVGLQYYLEATQDQAALLESSPNPEFEPDARRHVLTGRLTYRSRRDVITVSVFTFFSPSDDDHYLRPSLSYRQSDRWTFTAGANLFSGKRAHTFFGQLEDNSNAYVRVRYSF